ncbi:glycosyltransferase [Paraclostridium ghonii]|uniref:glycosyltransferase family 2 protein n=1 Tax=Paraclostridium ghonii TaxID=29358 RepID=UPI00202CDE7B|nr:glycosyltransferase [Paeniclostridium ghonii]MCM0164891.1 glycosyltransferase [Paeniclostridium ghonii]
MFSDISIIIPYKESTPERAQIFDFVINRYKTLMPDAEICIGRNEGVFNQAKSLNEAMKKSTRKYLLLMDSDVLINTDTINKCLEMIKIYDVVFTHDLLIRLTPEFSNHIMENNILIINQRLENFSGEYFHYPLNSICMLRKELLNKTGGFDDRFEGWGHTDTAFREILFAATPNITTLKFHTIYHLHHSYDPTFKNDAYLNKNAKIHQEYYSPSTIFETMSYLVDKYKNL